MDIVRGIGIVLFIALVAGGIAYVGDRVGHQVGRKRLTLFGIRPRYTSTIIAVGTGMIIALVVTLGAIIASQQVKTAFFRLNSINAEIVRLQAQQRELESKVQNGRIVLNTGTLMSQNALILTPNQTPAERLTSIKQYYQNTVQFLNTNYVPPLRRFVPPLDVDKLLADQANSIKLQSMLSRSNVIVLAATDQNLYERDPIHFNLDFYPDQLIFGASEPIAQISLPAGRNINAGFAANALYSRVASVAVDRHMPPYLTGYVVPVRTYPSADEMQKMLASGSGTYLLTAFAAQDIFPHTGVIPVVLTLAKAPTIR
ncbi:MAG: DUF3084 domain-containing protein [Candidatus Eremiobacteraeota bacterium]|nr:DUF3084 domain-containing protein [Candidatus Eremiobacteraeota bacterium]